MSVTPRSLRSNHAPNAKSAIPTCPPKHRVQLVKPGDPVHFEDCGEPTTAKERQILLHGLATGAIPLLQLAGVAPPAKPGQQFTLKHVSPELARELTTLVPASPECISGSHIPLRYDTVRPWAESRKEVDLVYKGGYVGSSSAAVLVVSVAHTAMSRNRRAPLSWLATAFVRAHVTPPRSATELDVLVGMSNAELSYLEFPLRIVRTATHLFFVERKRTA